MVKTAPGHTASSSEVEITKNPWFYFSKAKIMIKKWTEVSYKKRSSGYWAMGRKFCRKIRTFFLCFHRIQMGSHLRWAPEWKHRLEDPFTEQERSKLCAKRRIIDPKYASLLTLGWYKQLACFLWQKRLIFQSLRTWPTTDSQVPHGSHGKVKRRSYII